MRLEKKLTNICRLIKLLMLFIFSCVVYSEEECQNEQDVIRCYFHSSPYFYRSKDEALSENLLMLPPIINIHKDYFLENELLTSLVVYFNGLLKAHRMAQYPKLYNPHFPNVILRRSYDFDNEEDKKPIEYYNTMEMLAPSSELLQQVNELNPKAEMFFLLSIGVFELWPSLKTTQYRSLSKPSFRLEPGSTSQFGFEVDWSFKHNNLDSYEVLGIGGIVFDRSGRIVTSGFEGFKVGKTKDTTYYLIEDGGSNFESSQSWVISNQDLVYLLGECEYVFKCPVDIAYKQLITGLGIQ